MRIRCEDGVELHADRLSAVGEPRGVMVILHAMMADRRSMDRPSGAGLASTLAQRGWEVLNADFRGHGRSGHGGPWTYDDLVRLDVPALCRAARELEVGPVWLCGLSLGGHVSTAALAESSVRGAPIADGLIALSSNVWCPWAEPSAVQRALKQASTVGLLSVTRARGRFPARRMRIGPSDEARPYVEDLVRFWQSNAWTARDGTNWTQALQHCSVPIEVVVGRGDTLLARPMAVARFYSPAPHHRVHVLGRGQLGLGWDPDHMGLGSDPRCRGAWSWMADLPRVHRP